MATLYQLQEGLVKADQSGNDEDVEVLSSAIRQHPTYQKQGKTALSKGFGALSGDERKQAIAKHTAIALGVKPSELDAERGMGGFSRAQFKAQPTQEDKFKFLEKTYGRENLNVLDIAGEDQFLYRDEAETGGQWRRVDEEGVSLADWTTDLAVFAPEIAGAVVGGAKGAAAGTAVAPVVGTVVGAIGGAALGGFGAGVAQDVAVRAASGEDIQLGESVRRRGEEALYSAGFDAALLGTGKFAAKPLMKAVGKTDQAQSIMDSFSRLSKQGVALEEIPQVSKGAKAMEAYGRRIGETGGAGTRRAQGNIDAIAQAEQRLSGELPPLTKSDAIESMQARLRNSFDGDAAIVKGADEKVRAIYNNKGKLIRSNLQAKIEAEQAGLRLPKSFDSETVATRVRSLLGKQKNAINKESGVKFEEGLAAMDDISIPAETLQKNLSSSVNKLSGILDEGDIIAPLSGAQATSLGRGIKALEDMVERGDTIPFRELHNLKKALDGKAGWGSTAPSDNQLIARRSAGDVRKLLEKTAGNFGKKGEKYMNANQFFQDKVTPFRDKSIAPLLAPDVSPGSFKMYPDELATKVTKHTQQVKQMLANAGSGEGALRKELSNLYLDSVGRKLSEIDVNKGMAKLLFSNDRIAAIKRLQGLQKRLDVADSKIADVSIDDVMNRLSGDARKNAEKIVADKMREEAKINSLIKQSGFIKKIANGRAPLPSDPRSFADELLKHNNAEDISSFMARLAKEDPIAYQDVRQGITADFKDSIKFGGEGVQTTSGEVPLWKPGSVSKELSGKKGIKYEKAMGKDWVRDWKDLDNALQGSAITGQSITEQVRAVFTTGSGLLIVAAGVPKWVYGRAMNAVSGSKLLRPFIRNVEDDPSVMKNLIPYLVGSGEGLRALTLEAESDPEFAEWLDGYLNQAANAGQGQE